MSKKFRIIDNSNGGKSIGEGLYVESPTIVNILGHVLNLEKGGGYINFTNTEEFGEAVVISKRVKSHLEGLKAKGISVIDTNVPAPKRALEPPTQSQDRSVKVEAQPVVEEVKPEPKVEPKVEPKPQPKVEEKPQPPKQEPVVEKVVQPEPPKQPQPKPQPVVQKKVVEQPQPVEQPKVVEQPQPAQPQEEGVSN